MGNEAHLISELRAALKAAWLDGWNRAVADGRPREIDGAKELMAKKYVDKKLGASDAR